MGWIKKTKLIPDHRCLGPLLSKEDPVGNGSVWECDDCGLRWRLTNIYMSETVCSFSMKEVQ